VQEIHLKQQQAELFSYIFALCSDKPKERKVAELGAFELMRELEDSTLNLAAEFYSILKTKTEAYSQGGH
jgi:hypothetical protein